MSKPTTRAALLRSTVVPTVANGDDKNKIAVIGDNNPPADEPLPTVKEVHDGIENTLQTIVRNENAIEYARQKLSFQLFQRHALLVQNAPAGTVPEAHVLATSKEALLQYTADLSAEFNAASSATRKAMTEAEANKYNAATRARLERAAILFGLIAWAKMRGIHAEFNTKSGRWDVSPHCFVPVGYKAGGDLLMTGEGDAMTPRKSIELEAENKAHIYFVSKGRGQQQACRPSLDQFIYAMQQQVHAASNPTVDSSKNEATPQRAKRAARQAAATVEAATATPAPVVDGTTVPPAESLDMDRPDNVTAKSWACTKFAEAILTAAKWLALDDMISATREDIGTDACNAMADIALVYDRIQGEDAEDDGVPKRKRGKAA